ncbi:MAG: acyl-CoA thioesterase [Prevotellaceae bacterium]|jgi:acyl-CoA thioester hydrolase|nr:acyl-CoA thioesterase [Prevotellaceae bacterium]
MILKRTVETKLKETALVKIRFSEVDSMNVVWHGYYIRFFEDAREAFGLKYGIPYLDVYRNGYFTPVVSINCEYKSPLKYGDEALVEIIYIDTPAAKIIFKYNIYNAATGILAATGDSVQVFLSIADNCLSISIPAFFEEWKRKMGLITVNDLKIGGN